MSSHRDATSVALRVAAHLAVAISDARRARRWTLRDLAGRAGIAASWAHDVEHGRPASLETYAAIAKALDLELKLDLIDPRRRSNSAQTQDPVHSAMGEAVAARLRTHGFDVGIDEPYQHFQFAGRADVVAWNVPRRALIHVENRTQFPNLQDAAGSWNAKRQYLAASIAQRLGMRHGFDVVTHVMAGVWSAEVLHAIRIRPATFRAMCPDPPDDFERWWAGSLPPPGPATSTFVLFDPLADDAPRRRQFVDLESVGSARIRPRYRGYADAARALTRSGRA
jgi:transcriptional regulator with XRE-family HTH domain